MWREQRMIGRRNRIAQRLLACVMCALLVWSANKLFVWMWCKPTTGFRNYRKQHRRAPLVQSSASHEIRYGPGNITTDYALVGLIDEIRRNVRTIAFFLLSFYWIKASSWVQFCFLKQLTCHTSASLCNRHYSVPYVRFFVLNWQNAFVSSTESI